ncbi:MAG: lysophospholipid acyltransferase family protein [Gammaproteobacteria bacterium]
MFKQIDYLWRLFATGLSFGVFGIGSIILWFLVFPVANLLPGSRRNKRLRSQKCVHYSFYLFIGFMRRIGIMTYEINGLEKLNRPGQMIVANHPTLVDIVFLISRIPGANCIVKEQLWHNPFTRGPVVHAGYISNGDPVRMIEDCVACLRRGEVLIIFPEGTRSVPGSPYKFLRGAAAIALKAKTIVTPVVLTCVPSTLTKAEKWYQIPERRFHLAMHVGEDIALDDFLEINPETVAVRRVTRYLQDYFSRRREGNEQFGK